MKEILLTQGKIALVDDEDFEEVSKYSWSASFENGWYAQARVNGCRITLHKFLTKYAQTDHQDGNGLNNQRSNLRECSNSQNQWNQKIRIGGSSRFKGVTLQKRSGSWMVRIGFCGNVYHIGSFEKEEDAARAYDKRAIELFGEFARCNFPE